MSACNHGEFRIVFLLLVGGFCAHYPKERILRVGATIRLVNPCLSSGQLVVGATESISSFSSFSLHRRLVDMLSENQDVISFYPGSAKGPQVSVGRIVVHDRLKMEASILPRYFNHSSFASLRRQLNYFSFTRVGKGRQRGATYCNDGVVELDDILRLKRRSTVGAPAPSLPTRCVSDSSASSDDEVEQSRPTKKARPTIVSPISSQSAGGEDLPPCIVLDLTVPPALVGSQSVLIEPEAVGDADLLAGCHALLSFSRSSSGEMVA